MTIYEEDTATINIDRDTTNIVHRYAVIFGPSNHNTNEEVPIQTFIELSIKIFNSLRDFHQHILNESTKSTKSNSDAQIEVKANF